MTDTSIEKVATEMRVILKGDPENLVLMAKAAKTFQDTGYDRGGFYYPDIDVTISLYKTRKGVVVIQQMSKNRWRKSDGD